MTVRELLARIDSDELSEWMAFDQVHMSESWYQNAQLCALMANAWRAKGRKFSPADFLPRRPRGKRELLPAEGLKSAMRAALGKLRHAR